MKSQVKGLLMAAVAQSLVRVNLLAFDAGLLEHSVIISQN
jgi:hypothetical protein